MKSIEEIAEVVNPGTFARIISLNEDPDQDRSATFIGNYKLFCILARLECSLVEYGMGYSGRAEFISEKRYRPISSLTVAEWGFCACQTEDVTVAKAATNGMNTNRPDG
ncbi:unnamed protein product [Fusarium venenatum]|uniref:Uncharacterized protein n=1 Tax=Fusarium venenatum TaxID=56646 RepID=A0A2L2TVN7_9HYPO|nr:uncharacterized protein FVRRES_08513 [Fusarium venenatum]CEI68436.1 unnamed protein product [Fusarium venenatum]